MKDHPIAYERLIAFATENLGAAEATEVERHLSECPTCAVTVERYRATRRTVATDRSEAPPRITLERAYDIQRRAGRREPARAGILERLVASLAFDSRAGLALAGARGGTAGYHLGFESDAADVDLQIDPSAKPEDRKWSLLGQVAARGDESIGRVTAARAGTDDVVAVAEPDPHGVFTLSVEPGRYDVRVEVDGRLLVLPDLEVS